MKYRIQFITIVLLLCTFALVTSAQKKKAIATVFKPVGTVDYQEVDKDWVKAKPSMLLFTGDKIRTLENSFAVVKFLENSIIRVQEKSEVTINGEIAKGEYSKNVHLRQGEVGFNVKKRPNEKFEFSTPTSVASIRGTDGLLIAGSDSNDVLILGSGNVEFKNLISNTITNVSGGQTAFSMANGSVTVNQSTPEEQRLMEQGSTDTTKSEGSNQGGTPTDSTTAPAPSTTSTTGVSIGMTINAPVGKEKQDLIVSVEITSASITMDSLKKSVIDFTLFYRSKPDQSFKMIKAQFSDRVTRFTIPAADVFDPGIGVYVTIKLQDGSEFSTPATSPETNPQLLPIQAGQKNELKIPFTDPSGKKKTMIIEYK